MSNPTIQKYLLKWQTNELFSLIEAWGLSPRAFSWSVDESSPMLKSVSLNHSQSGYYFTFNYLGPGGPIMSCSYAPGTNTMIDSHAGGDWDEVTQTFAVWLQSLKREISAVDLWSELSKESIFIKSASEEKTNAPFTKIEQEQIATTLNEIKQYIFKTQSPNTSEAKLIDAKIQYLVEASERIGRKDWKIMAVSILLSLAVDHPDKARDLFQFAGKAFMWLYHSSLHLLF
jgi:hypothetical protein